MASSGGDWFGNFKTDLSDQFDRNAVAQMSMYFSLTRNKTDQVNESKNSGLALLSVLEDLDKIGPEKGIDELCEALRFCDLNKTARLAETSFKNPRKIPSIDIPDGVNINLDDIKDTLHDELTSQDCLEIAMSLGLRAHFIQDIKESKDSSAGALIQKLHDSNIINGSSISALLFALRNRGLIRVAKLIQNAELKALPSSANTTVTEPSKECERSTCVCGENSFEELKSESDESSVVSLRCSAQSCLAEWFPGSDYSGHLSMTKNKKKYLYKIPFKLNLSDLKHEIVKNAKELQRGDHIVLRRFGMYDHHAIFISHNEKGKIKVIHWTTPEVNSLFSKKAVIKCEDKKFPKDGVRCFQYPKDVVDPADVVIARAYHMMYDSNQKYDLVNNNCESLATYCKIGKAFTIQGKAVGDVLPFLFKKFGNKPHKQ